MNPFSENRQVHWSAGSVFDDESLYGDSSNLSSIVVSALQKKKEYEKQMSEKTFLIRQ